LISCVGKIMERVVYKNVYYYLVRNGWFCQDRTLFFRSNIWMKSTISLAVTKMSVIESLVLLSKGVLIFLGRFLEPEWLLFFYFLNYISHWNGVFFYRAEREIYFQNLTLGFITKTLNQIIFFPPPKSEYFFQQHWESEYFFRKKT
jgi:hypothetical protein